MASRPPSASKIEIEAADDFILPTSTTIDQASFTGVFTAGAQLSDIQSVDVEVYRVFPKDSVNPPSGRVPTRVNSPSDDAFGQRDSTGGTLSFTASVLNSSFTAANSVRNGINSIPNQTTGGEGPVSGSEVRFDVTFSPALTLPADHYFFVPQVKLATGDFYWLSAPGPPLFTGDLQTWIRNASLDPDWLRVGTDIVGGSPAPRFNASFSLSGFGFTFLPQGAFVLGDQTVATASPTTTVTWWSSKWSRLNSLSGGPAPPSFKGFAKTTSTTPPTCGGAWTSSPGTSSGPPASVPDYMPVIVSSSIKKSGPTISGDIVHIVLVKTNPGYSPDPISPGTGTIVATIC